MRPRPGEEFSTAWSGLQGSGPHKPTSSTTHSKPEGAPSMTHVTSSTSSQLEAAVSSHSARCSDCTGVVLAAPTQDTCTSQPSFEREREYTEALRPRQLLVPAMSRVSCPGPGHGAPSAKHTQADISRLKHARGVQTMPSCCPQADADRQQRVSSTLRF